MELTHTTVFFFEVHVNHGHEDDPPPFIFYFILFFFKF